MIFKDNYEWISGWVHDYYCDNDGSELIFDLNNNTFFECPLCHFKYTDEKRQRAWVIKYRYKIFESLENYSKEYLESKNEELLSYIEDALNYYSLNYDRFVCHNKDGEIYDVMKDTSKNYGRITAQGLNEAMITIQIVNCIKNISLYLDNNTKESVFNLLFPKIYELLIPQINKIHNICCYEVCAIAMMGIITNNKDMLKFAFSSTYSFYEQLNRGLTKEYFWFEGSFHYHFFVLKPILELLRLAKMYNYEIPNKYYDIGKKMLVLGYNCSFNDCSLPSPNDGWPNKHLTDYIEVYSLGNELYNNEFSNIIESIGNKSNRTGSVHLIDSGFSILKNEFWNVFVKYKDNALNRAHPDKLNIEIKCGNNFLTHDLSTSGYGSEISKYYKSTYSHNTIVIDGKKQNPECKTVVDSYDDKMINIRINDFYDNVAVSKKIQLLENKIIDWTSVDGYSDKITDYFFHCDAQLITKLDYKVVGPFDEYPYLKDFKEVSFNKDSLNLEWKLDDKFLVSKIDLKDKKLYICESPDNPNVKNRTTLIIRGSNKANSFRIEWLRK